MKSHRSKTQRAWKAAPEVKCLLCKHRDSSLIPGTHIKVKASFGVCARNLDTGDGEIDPLVHLASNGYWTSPKPGRDLVSNKNNDRT